MIAVHFFSLLHPSENSHLSVSVLHLPSYNLLFTFLSCDPSAHIHYFILLFKIEMAYLFPKTQ